MCKNFDSINIKTVLIASFLGFTLGFLTAHWRSTEEVRPNIELSYVDDQDISIDSSAANDKQNLLKE